MCRCLSANRTHVSVFPIVEQHTHPLTKQLSFLCFFSSSRILSLVCFSLLFNKMNIHLNLNLNQMGNMIYEDPRRMEGEDIVQGVSRTFSEEEEEEDTSSCSLSSMCSSSDLTEDDDDEVSSSSSNGPLEDLSDLMAHLPIKRGLSKFYEGRSQSFTSLANVKSLEDLMKRGFQNRNYGAKKKSCRSTGGILEQSYKRVYSPKATISKKPNKTPSSALSCLSRRRH